MDNTKNHDWRLNVRNCSGEFLKTDFDDFITLIAKIFCRRLQLHCITDASVADIMNEHKGEGIEYDLLNKGISCIQDGMCPEYIKTLLDFEILKRISSEPKLSDEKIMKSLIARDTVLALRLEEEYVAVIETFGNYLCSKYDEIFERELWSKVDLSYRGKDAEKYIWTSNGGYKVEKETQ